MKLSWNSKYTELAIDTLSAAIFTLGFSTAFFFVRGLEIGIWQTALLAAVQALLILLLSRNWYAAPVLFAGSAVFTLTILWRLDMLGEALEYIAGILQYTGFFLRTGDALGQSEWLIAAMLMLPLSCLLFWFVRRISWLAAYAGIIAIIYMPLFIWFPGVFTAFLISLAGLLIQLPRHFSLTLEKNRPKDTRLPRGPMQLLAVPVVIVSIVLANSLVPANTGNWRWAPLVNRITDIQDLWYNSLGTARSWQAFTLADYGFIPSGYRLGGPVTLSERTILRVRSENNLLLRGVSSSIYTGNSWHKPQRQHYRFDSNLWRFIRRRAFDSDLPAAAEGREFRQRFAQEISISVEPVINSSTIFSAGRVSSIELEDKLNYPPYFTESSDLFVFSPLPRNNLYTVEATWLDRNREGFEEALLRLEQNISRTDRNWPQIQEEYLQLPPDLPAVVAATASQVAAGADSPYSRALLLEHFLRDDFIYSLSPEMPREDEDFVAHFLETRTGYCVYFASAMVVMARTLGIPARYVEGFTLEPAVSDGSWLATGQNAHSWAELYFYGIGWLTFDPTPGDRPTEPDEPPLNGDVTPAPEPSPEPTPAGPPDLPDQPDEEASLLWLVLLIAMALLLILIRLAILLARYRHNQRFLPDYVRRKRPEPTARLEFYYRDFLRQLSCIEVKPEAGETMKRFAARADRHLRFFDHNVPKALEAVSNWFYGDLEPTESDIERLALLHRRMEERLRESLPGMAYFLKRVLR